MKEFLEALHSDFEANNNHFAAAVIFMIQQEDLQGALEAIELLEEISKAAPGTEEYEALIDRRDKLTRAYRGKIKVEAANEF
jgi:hypothetical protein